MLVIWLLWCVLLLLSLKYFFSISVILFTRFQYENNPKKCRVKCLMIIKAKYLISPPLPCLVVNSWQKYLTEKIATKLATKNLAQVWKTLLNTAWQNFIFSPFPPGRVNWNYLLHYRTSNLSRFFFQFCPI